MKLYFISIIILFITGCSFDNKSGIWTSEKDLKKNSDILKDFKKISVSEDAFDKIISLEDNKKIEILSAVNNFNWNDITFCSIFLKYCTNTTTFCWGIWFQ